VAAAPLTLPLFEGVPNLARLIPIKKKTFRRHWISLWQECRQEKWDIIIDIRGSLVPYFLKSQDRYTWKPSFSQEHRVVQLGYLIGRNPPPLPHLWLNPHHRQKAQNLIQATLPVLAVAPAANWVGKQWPSSAFAALIKQFLKHHDAKIAVFAAPQERASIKEILSTIPKDRCLDLVGTLSFLEIAACLQRCHMFIGNDSGLMHMAAAMGTPTIGLFGPSDDRLYAPYCSPEAPVNQVIRTPQSLDELKKLPGFAFDAPQTFMDSLSPDTVFPILKKMWDQTDTHFR